LADGVNVHRPFFVWWEIQADLPLGSYDGDNYYELTKNSLFCLQLFLGGV
jgi:hypothetical protein